jgi:hypothetical protein
MKEPSEKEYCRIGKRKNKNWGGLFRFSPTSIYYEEEEAKKKKKN